MQLIKRQATQQNWWLLGLSGVVTIIFGIAIMAWPKLSLAIVLYLFGAAAVIYGILTLCTAFSHHKEPGGRGIPLGGLVSLIIGILTFLFPHMAGQVLAYLIGVWALLIGVIALVIAFSSAFSTAHRWLYVLVGLLAFVLGVFLLIHPTAILSVIWLVGALTIAYGVLLLTSVMFPGKAAQEPQSDLNIS